ncbi:CapA family protein [Metabacillus sp. GX 13764]|uniref:CapA family protein n=1 Tax=Metabacillus kandeliae TaxID=2900151 RepID=UPI001E2AB4F9|nr:CapA family protein [Metabacillus kandeliae]MCD7035589.1 CapA family protein [Metabacillus kandeliae]
MSGPSGKRKLNFQEKLLIFMKRNKLNTTKQVFFWLAVSALIMFGFSFAKSEQGQPELKYKDEIFTASFMGDIMMGREVKKVTDHKGYDYLFQNVKPLLQNSDYSTANFEHPVADGLKGGKDPQHIHIGTDTEAVKALQNMNFTVANLANTHALDYGIQGLDKTFSVMKQHGIDPVGAGRTLEEAKRRISYREYNGIKVATLGFTDIYPKDYNATKLNPGVLPMKPKIFIPLIAEAKEKADLVIVNAHWGQEYDTKPHPRQKEFAHAMADAGADVIAGHHPHVLSPVEKYKDTVIFYSLGNFIFDQGWTRTRESAIAQLRVMKDQKARFEITPLQIREGQPSPLRNINQIQKKRIFKTLTKDMKNVDWKEKNGKLIFEMDYDKKL